MTNADGETPQVQAEQCLCACNSEISALRSALAASEAGRRWRPIETAPDRDVLLLSKHGGMAIDNWWFYRKFNAPQWTHWMPLPDPPQGLGEAAEGAGSQNRKPEVDVYASMLGLLQAASQMGLSCAEAIDEQDGEIGFDWEVASRGCVLSVSVRRDGRFSWAALVGEWKAHGTCHGHADDALIEAMRKYAAWEAAEDAGSPQEP